MSIICRLILVDIFSQLLFGFFYRKQIRIQKLFSNYRVPVVQKQVQNIVFSVSGEGSARRHPCFVHICCWVSSNLLRWCNLFFQQVSWGAFVTALNIAQLYCLTNILKTKSITYFQEYFGEIYIFILKAQYHHAIFKAYFFFFSKIHQTCVCVRSNMWQLTYIHSFSQAC